jgi:hypothetical protein
MSVMTSAKSSADVTLPSTVTLIVVSGIMPWLVAASID